MYYYMIWFSNVVSGPSLLVSCYFCSVFSNLFILYLLSFVAYPYFCIIPDEGKAKEEAESSGARVVG